MFQLLVNRVRLPRAGTTPAQRVGGFSVSSGDFTLNHPDSLQLTVVVLDRENDPMAVTPNYASSDPSVATIDSTGLITSVAEGAATITISLDRRRTTLICTVNDASPSVVDDVNVVSPAESVALLVDSSQWFESIPLSGGVELPATLTWESETPGIVSFDPTSQDTYRHIRVIGEAIGTTRVRAVAEGAGAGGIDINGEYTDVSIISEPPEGDPNMPVDMLEIAEWTVGARSHFGGVETGYGIPYPANTPNAAGYTVTAPADYQRIALIADPSTPGGYFIRVYLPPNFIGGSGPDHFSKTFAVGAHGNSRYKEIYRSVLKRMHPDFTAGSFGISGMKESFIRFQDDANDLANTTYFNEHQTNNGKMGFNVQGLGTPTPPAVANDQTLVGWTTLDDGAFHLIEDILRVQSATNIIDGEWHRFVDGALSESKLTKQFVPAGINPQNYGWEKELRTHTYGGGHDNPPGVVGTGFNGKFVRVSSANVAPGAVDPTNTRRFIRSSGTFGTNQSAMWYGVKADGTHVGPYDLSGSGNGYINSTTLQFPTGVNMTGVVVIYRGIEMFNAAAVGTAMTFRSSALDYHPASNPGGTGLYPVIGSGTVASVGTTNYPNDTVFITGVDLTGASWAFGIQGDLTGPLYMDFARIKHGGKA